MELNLENDHICTMMEKKANIQGLLNTLYLLHCIEILDMNSFIYGFCLRASTLSHSELRINHVWEMDQY